MGHVDLEHFKSRRYTALCRSPKLIRYLSDIIGGHLLWYGVTGVEWNHTWRQRYPAAFRLVQAQPTAPGHIC